MTLRDQHGDLLPLFTWTMGYYNESLKLLLTAPFIWLFGLNEFATRLPIALIGISTVWVLFALVKEYANERLALAAGLLLAISPWHLQFSRSSVRATLVPFFFCLALFLFVKSLRRPQYLVLSALVFAISLHTYYSARVTVPLFVAGLLVLFWRELWQAKKPTLVAFALFLGIFVPLAWFWISPQGMARANETLVTDPLAILTYYLSYYDPRFLFLEGDPNIRHSLRDFGQLHLFELVTVPVGLWTVFKEHRKEHWILWIWLILYPVPAAFTEPHHAMRSMVGAPLFAVFSAHGLMRAIDFFQHTRLRTPMMLASALVVMLSSLFHLKSYFLDYPKYSAMAWQYGMKEAIAFTERSAHRDVVISRRLVPYIFVLFYTKYPPSEYLRLPLHLRERMWAYSDRPLGKYYFPSIRSLIIPAGTGLLVCRPDELNALTIKGYAWREVHDIADPLGKKLITIVEVTGTGLQHSLSTSRAAIRADPLHLEGYLGLGTILEAMVDAGETIDDAALELFTTVLQGRFEFAKSDDYVHLGDIFSALGRTDEASTAYGIALDLDPIRRSRLE